MRTQRSLLLLRRGGEVCLVDLAVDDGAGFGEFAPDGGGFEAHDVDGHRLAYAVGAGGAEVAVVAFEDPLDGAGAAAQIAREPRVVGRGHVLDGHPVAYGEGRRFG